MASSYQMTCPACGHRHDQDDYQGWDKLGTHDCVKCGAKDVLDVDYSSDVDLDPIEDEPTS